MLLQGARLSLGASTNMGGHKYYCWALVPTWVICSLRGVQKQPGFKHIKTIAGVLEEALQCLKPANDVHVVTSSRTDAGVHALCSSVHVDLVPQQDSQEYDPVVLRCALNNTLAQLEEPVRIIDALRVADNFHARFQAIGRQYVYRSVICNKGELLGVPYPVLEFQRSCLVRGSIDFDLVQKAADILRGEHNFSYFTNPSNLKKQPWVNPVKNLDVQVEKSETFLEKYMQHWFSENYQAVDFVFKSHSFLYKQVLRMVSTMLGVGRGHVTLDHLQNMVDDPQNCPPLQNQHIYNVPPCGLYLANVFYKAQDLQWPKPDDSDDKITNLVDKPQTCTECSYDVIKEDEER